MKYKFKFEASEDPRKGIPYVAKLYLENEKIQRQFFNLQRFYGKKQVTVYGEFEADEGDVIEMRTEASWKKDYKKIFIVHNGELKFIGYAFKNDTLLKIYKYLKKEISINELVETNKEEENV